MAEDEKVVQETEVKASEPKVEPQTISLEDARTLIAEAKEQAILEAKGQLESKYQSLKDKEVKGFAKKEKLARLQAESANQMLGVFGTQLNQTNPELAQQWQNTNLQRDNYLMRQRQEAEDLDKQQEEAQADFAATMESTVINLGLNKDDARIDWARDAGTVGEQTKRILASVTKAKKEDESSIEERILAKIQKSIADKEANERANDGTDSVVTSVAGSAGSKKIYTVAQLDDPKFVDANWEDIQLAQAEGRIKE